MDSLRQRLTRLLSSGTSKKEVDTLCSQCQTLDLPFLFMYHGFGSLAQPPPDELTWAAERSLVIQSHFEEARKNDEERQRCLDLGIQEESEYAASDATSVTFVNDTQSDLSVFPCIAASEIIITPSIEGGEPLRLPIARTIHLNWLDDIAANQNCPICRLITVYAEICHPHIRSDYLIHPNHRVGVSLEVLPLRVLTATIPPCHTRSNYLQPVFATRGGELARHKTYFVNGTEHLIPWDSNGSEETPPLEPLYRFTHGHTVDLTRLKRWLDICETTHTETTCRKERLMKNNKVRPLIGNECHAIETVPAALETGRIINVCSRMVFEMPTDCRYVALGHRQSFPQSATTAFSLWKRAFTRFTFAHLPHNLPAVFEDAITITRELGETYLWIDALCVLETEEDLSYTLDHRASIYDDAVLTLIAATDEPSWGLPGLRYGSRYPHSQIPTVAKGVEIYLSWPLLREELEGFGYDGNDAAAWSWRYKIYKASLKCRRTLVFGDYQVYWKCAEEELDEVDERDKRRGYRKTRI